MEAVAKGMIEWSSNVSSSNRQVLTTSTSCRPVDVVAEWGGMESATWHMLQSCNVQTRNIAKSKHTRMQLCRQGGPLRSAVEVPQIGRQVYEENDDHSDV